VIEYGGGLNWAEEIEQATEAVPADPGVRLPGLGPHVGVGLPGLEGLTVQTIWPVGVIPPLPVTEAVKFNVCPVVVGGALIVTVGIACPTVKVANPLAKP
jgi:hypothetical protein